MSMVAHAMPATRPPLPPRMSISARSDDAQERSSRGADAPTLGEIFTRVRAQAEGAVPAAEIDRALDALSSQSVPLERGVVGPTGASSMLSFSVLGPIFGLYGVYAGSAIVRRAAGARAYLTELDACIARREQALAACQAQIGQSPERAASREDLALRLLALRAFREGVSRSGNEQLFNVAFPGVTQLAASSLIVTLAADLAPTMGKGAPLLATSVTAALSVAAASALGLYAGASLVKHGSDLIGSLRTHRLEPRESDPDWLKRYLEQYNQGLTAHRAYHGLNTASWGLYVGGAAALAAISAGAAASHGAAVAAVVVGALAAVAWDVALGERCAPHNAATPHVDRDFTTSLARRAEVAELLVEELDDTERFIRDTLRGLPATHAQGRASSVLKPHKRLSKEKRFQYFWQLLPANAGLHKLSQWAVRDLSVADPAAHALMLRLIGRDGTYFASRAGALAQALGERSEELSRGGDVPEALRALCAGDAARVEAEAQRLGAMNELERLLEGIDPARVRDDPEQTARWNLARLAFVSLEGLEGQLFRPDEVRANPTWFTFETQRAGLLRRERIHRLHLTTEGLEALSRAGFTSDLERRFIELLADRRRLRYELHTVEGLELAANRGERRASTLAELAALRASAARTPEPSSSTSGACPSTISTLEQEEQGALP